MKRTLALPLLLLAATANAGELADYGWAWPLQLEGAGSTWQLELPPQVHEVLATDDQRDFEIFDARGKPVPTARYSPPRPEATKRSVVLPTFALPRRSDGVAIDASLRVERAPDGSVQRIDAGVQRAGARPELTDYLLDITRVDDPIAELTLTWPTRNEDVNARYAVEASDDLENWRTLVPAAAIVELRSGASSLEQRRIVLPRAEARYLLLRALERNFAPAALVATATVIEEPPDAPLQWVEARPTAKRDGVLHYEIDGLYDVEAVRIVPQGASSLATIGVRSGDTHRATLTLVSVAHANGRLVQNEADLAPAPRNRRWSLDAEPELDVAPRLLLGTRPDRFAFIAEGEGPYTLAAGSATARRTDAPVSAAIAEIARREGPTWQPPLARLGERRVLSGSDALDKKLETPLPWTTIALWSVLLAGAALVAALAVRLLRSGAA